MSKLDQVAKLFKMAQEGKGLSGMAESAARMGRPMLTEAENAARLAAMEKLMAEGGKINPSALPSKIPTAGKSVEELKAYQSVLDNAGIGAHDPRMQFTQQAINRAADKVAAMEAAKAAGGPSAYAQGVALRNKAPMAAVGALGAGGLALGSSNEAAAAEIPPVEPPKPLMPEEPGMVAKGLDLVGTGLEKLDKYTGRPTRAALLGAMEGRNPLAAAKESITQDKNVSGEDVANKFLEKTEESGIPLRGPGQTEFVAAKPLGMAVDMLADPAAALPLGKFGKIKKLFGQ